MNKKPHLSQLAHYLAGLMIVNPEDKRISKCGSCGEESYIAEYLPLENEEGLRISTAICFNCSAKSMEYNVQGNARNEPCACGSKKKFKNCCLDLCIENNRRKTKLAKHNDPSN